ncbi:hypothetical protein P3T76_008034 [Phytophthora citrophthora]|uniref:Uncharacterized protein n=1 Tax=Phytophthora citrophthora TaxID=4793 RepID=A0AAD9LL10_9STRA|nr:hypothetical protein P3T76_008034 [Phytophthora citrophthora]
MDYRQYAAPAANPMVSSARGMARLNGSNRAAWNAMDLQIGAQMPSNNARGTPADGGALSARNVLLQKRLRERKRYDSADEAMKKAAASAANRYQTQTPAQSQAPVQVPQNQNQPSEVHHERPFSPAQIGQSAFFNAMNDSAKPKRSVQRNTPKSTYEPPGGAEQGRNVLIQRKLQSKSSFDSADYQMAKAHREHSSDMEDTPMEDVSEPKEEEAASSPCATSVNARRQQFASMSPSRAGKYGALENKKKPSRRELLEKQQKGTDQDEEMVAEEKTELGSNYGKLSAAHVLIRRKLKERKRFDSADYAMEKQGQQTDVPADVAANPAAPGSYGTMGASPASIDHQVKHIKLSEAPSGRVATPTPVVANAAQAALAARQARYAGLKGAGKPNPTANSAPQAAALDRYGLDKSAPPSGAAVARNLVLERKLAERKIFDSADHFKKAA